MEQVGADRARGGVAAAYPGVTYAAEPRRWDDVLDKMEDLQRTSRAHSLSGDQLESVKCRLLARVGWLTLVGELLWLPESIDDWDIWVREDGWGATNASVEDWLDEYSRRIPVEKSGHASLHHYRDDALDECWRALDELISEGDITYLRSSGIQRTSEGRLSF